MPLTRVRTSPYVSNGINRIRYNALQIDYTPAPSASQGPAPQCVLEYSDDGRTWSDEIVHSMGSVGNFKHYTIFWRLGVSRRRIFRITDTGNIAGITGATVTIDPGRT